MLRKSVDGEVIDEALLPSLCNHGPDVLILRAPAKFRELSKCALGARASHAAAPASLRASFPERDGG